jgi:polyisoprenoid-binding protein YceI
VTGQLVAQDSVTWAGARATVTVMLDSLVTGYRIRDAYARRAVLETRQYPVFELEVDSLAGVVGTDTIQALVAGTLKLRGVTTPVRFPVVAWREAGGLRVKGQLSFPAHELVDTYRMSSWALGLGVGLKRWRTVYLGADLLLRRAAP